MEKKKINEGQGYRAPLDSYPHSMPYVKTMVLKPKPVDSDKKEKNNES